MALLNCFIISVIPILQTNLDAFQLLEVREPKNWSLLSLELKYKIL